MPRTPYFDEITNSVTQADIDKFLRTAGPEDFKEQVRSAPDQLTWMRFVAGYLIRTKQITPERLGKAGKNTRTAAAMITKAKPVRRRATKAASTTVVATESTPSPTASEASVLE